MSAAAKPTCPECGKHEIVEMCSTRTAYPIVSVIDGEPETGVGGTGSEGDFDGFQCRDCFFESNEIGDFLAL